jgi:hypothetical protein
MDLNSRVSAMSRNFPPTPGSAVSESFSTYRGESPAPTVRAAAPSTQSKLQTKHVVGILLACAALYVFKTKKSTVPARALSEDDDDDPLFQPL